MQEKTKKKKYPAVLRRIALVVLGILLGLNVYLTNARSLAGNKLPMPLGFGLAVVLSGSMEPTLSVNDVIVVTGDSTYEVGDIVVYDDGRALIVHEIIAIDGDTVTTKGKANDVADEPIEIEQIKGKVVFTIPQAGVVLNVLRSPVSIVVIILAAILLIECSFRRKKEKDETRLEEIKEEIKKLKGEQNIPEQETSEQDNPKQDNPKQE